MHAPKEFKSLRAMGSKTLGQAWKPYLVLTFMRAGYHDLVCGSGP